MNCSAPPLPPATTARPGDQGEGQYCHAGSVCPNMFAGTGKGCCPYTNAVCCPDAQTCCPKGAACAPPREGPAWTTSTTCTGAPAGQELALAVCKTGAALPLSASLPNVLIIGDSVSIGYTTIVAKKMAGVALVQHSPYDLYDGGAEDTAYGVQCLDYMLRSPRGVFLKPDVIMFNWGLHDGPLSNETIPGSNGKPAAYAGNLGVIAQQLLALAPQAKLLFALTSPYMCSALQDGCVVNLNNQASALMQTYGIPTVDLYSPVVSKCGPPPQQKCFKVKECFCPHCSRRGGAGYEYISKVAVVPALIKLLPNTTGTSGNEKAQARVAGALLGIAAGAAALVFSCKGGRCFATRYSYSISAEESAGSGSTSTAADDVADDGGGDDGDDGDGDGDDGCGDGDDDNGVAALLG